MDGAGHKVLLSDTSPAAFRPLPDAQSPTPAPLQGAGGPLALPGIRGALGELVLLPLPPLLPEGPGVGGRVLLGTGAAVGVAGVRGARLARPLDLPPPPAGYLAGVWGRRVGAAQPAALGGLDGVLHLAGGLRERAEAWQAARGDGTPPEGGLAEGSLEAGDPQALVTLHLELGAGAAGLRAAASAPGAPVAALAVRRGRNGTLELAVAEQEADGRGSGASGSSGADQSALSQPWAWPLASAEAPSLARYEALARELVARHSLAGNKGLSSVRLLAAAADALALLRFDLEVQHARAPNASSLPAGTFDLRPGTFERWQATVQVKTGEAGELQLVPITAQRLEATHGSISFSPLSQVMQLGNMTLPMDLNFVYPAMDAVY
ncbi:hypothetical protein WJX81_000962 [Elliptochloris bilobata]|uniref:Uncharacterized protein n=1 Tax=Elliptochloris bilobata TaxID=381761 RepID=A0AAW1S8P9_9CHLO